MGWIGSCQRHVVVLAVTACLLASVASAGSAELVNGVSVEGISGEAGSEQYYTIVVPDGQDELVISMSGGVGDCDLYVRRDADPTTTAYDYRPYQTGNDESVTVTSPAAGIWHIMLRGFTDYSDLTLEASYSSNTTVVALTNGMAMEGLAAAADSETFYQIDVPEGQSRLEIGISGGTGDCDLYVKQGVLPTTDVYTYRPFLPGNNEAVVIDSPTPGRWYIMLKGFRDYAGLTLLASAIRPSSGEPACSAITITGNGDLTIDGYVSHFYPMTTDIADEPWPNVATEGPAGGKEASDSATHEMVWTTFDYATEPSATATASFTVNMDLFSGDVGNWASGEYWVKLELFGSGGTLIDSDEVRSGKITVVDTADLTESKVITVSVTTPSVLVDSGNCANLHLTAGATVEALTAGVTDGKPDDGVIVLANGVPVGGLSGSVASEKYFKIDVPAGQARLEVSTSGGSGDVDLYVRKGAKPTTRDWDFRPYLIGNDETVSINNPAAETYYILLEGAEAYSGTTLLASFGDTEPRTR